MDNEGVAGVLEQLADLLEIEGASPFRVRAYRGAARTVGALASPVGALPERGPGALEELPGIGKDLAGKIREIAATGELGLLHELKERTPESLLGLLDITGLGPKRAKAIYEGLGIDTIDALEKAAREGRLRSLKGVGPKLEAQILEGIAARARRGKRILLSDADAEIAPILERLRGAAHVSAVEVAGSYRRRKDTVGDVDILVTTDDGAKEIGKLLTSYAGVERVLADGETRTSVALRSGLQVDLRVVPKESFGAAMHYFTGSKAHNIAIRMLGVRKKLKINEYGVFDDGTRLSGEREEDVFGSVGLAFVPPELREDRGEIDAAREGKLPKLCSQNDLVGDVVDVPTSEHMDERVTSLVTACRDRGYSFVVVLGPREMVAADGESVRRKFLRSVAHAAAHVKGIAVHPGVTVGVRDNGDLDAESDALADFIVRAELSNASALEEKERTGRLITAIDKGQVHIVARPTAVFQKEKLAQVDAEAIAKFAKKCRAFLELDARPDRLASADGYARVARDIGTKLLLASHATTPDELGLVRYGVDQARRGWCEAKDVANTDKAPRFVKP
ncbi:MAG: DNA polymerase III [Polyangiaceae bacterium]|nr:DNA polymerase III [Polyangiaceae bacterium]